MPRTGQAVVLDDDGAGPAELLPSGKKTATKQRKRVPKKRGKGKPGVTMKTEEPKRKGKGRAKTEPDHESSDQCVLCGNGKSPDIICMCITTLTKSGISFSSSFDSGNLNCNSSCMIVKEDKLVGKQKKQRVSVEAPTYKDCAGAKCANNNRSWFHFKVSGGR